jgi:hypothetical protein
MREKADANALFSGRLCPQYLLLGYRRILVLWRSGRRIPPPAAICLHRSITCRAEQHKHQKTNNFYGSRNISGTTPALRFVAPCSTSQFVARLLKDL